MAAGGGLTAWDLSGYGNHGTLTNGPTWTVGEKGRRLDFSNANGYTEHPWGKLTGSAARTILYRVQTTATPSMWMHVVSWGDYVSSDGTACVATVEDGEFGLRVANGNRVFTGAINDGQWHDACLVVNGTATDDVIGYLDGQPAAIKRTVSCTLNTSSTALWFAKHEPSTFMGEEYDGLLGEVVIWSRALAPSEIQQQYVRPWDMLTPRSRVFPAAPAAGGDITGDAAQTLPSLSQSAAGEVEVSGDAGQTLPSLTQSAAGSLGRIGTAAQVLPALEQSAAGEVNVQGVAAQILPALDQAAAGTTATRTGEIAQSLPSLTQSAAGRPVTPDPYRVVAGGVWHAGAVAGHVFTPGAVPGGVWHAGAVAGQVCA